MKNNIIIRNCKMSRKIPLNRQSFLSPKLTLLFQIAFDLNKQHNFLLDTKSTTGILEYSFQHHAYTVDIADYALFDKKLIACH